MSTTPKQAEVEEKAPVMVLRSHKRKLVEMPETQGLPIFFSPSGTAAEQKRELSLPTGTARLTKDMTADRLQFRFCVNREHIVSFASRKEHCHPCRLGRHCVKHQEKVINLFDLPEEYWVASGIPDDMWPMIEIDDMSSLESHLHLSNLLPAPALAAPRCLTDNTRTVGYWAMWHAIDEHRQVLRASVDAAAKEDESLFVTHTARELVDMVVFEELVITRLHFSISGILQTARKMIGAGIGPIPDSMLSTYDTGFIPKVIYIGGRATFSLHCKDGFVRVSRCS
jgi:hypothetical protein